MDFSLKVASKQKAWFPTEWKHGHVWENTVSLLRFVELPDVVEQFVFCRQLETRTTGVDIFAEVNTQFQECLLWNNCISICSDGVAAVMGHVKGFLSFEQKENPSSVTTHCFYIEKLPW